MIGDDWIKRYVALTDLARGGGPKVGSKRRDILVYLPINASPEEIEKEAARIDGKKLEHLFIFGVY